jgi:hypothetical protein
LDLRSLARLNYSAAGREQAVLEVEHLAYVRCEIVRQIEERRAPLIADRDRLREMLDVLYWAAVIAANYAAALGAPLLLFDDESVFSLDVKDVRVAC